MSLNEEFVSSTEPERPSVAEARELIAVIIAKNTSGLDEDVEVVKASMQELRYKLGHLLKMLTNDRHNWKNADVSQTEVTIRLDGNPCDDVYNHPNPPIKYQDHKTQYERKPSKQFVSVGTMVDKISTVFKPKVRNANTTTTHSLHDTCSPEHTCVHVREKLPQSRPANQKEPSYQGGFCRCPGSGNQVEFFK